MAHVDEHAHKGQYSVRVGERGRLVLPAELRSQVGIEPGDRLVVTVEDDGSIRMVTFRDAVRSVRGMLRKWIPYDENNLLSDELIADRRREAAAE